MNSIFGARRGFDYSSLFEGSSSASKAGLGGISFSELNMIRTGAYKKLASKHYGKKQILTNNKNTAKPADKAQMESLSDSKSLAGSLRKAAADLRQENFTDRDAALKKLQSFVGAYNRVIRSADTTENTSILRRTAGMASATSSVRKLLKSVGVSIEKGNTLKIDEEAFKKADESALKSVFNGRFSYSDRVIGASSAIESIASNKLSSMSGKLYNHTGGYRKSDYTTKIDKAV